MGLNRRGMNSPISWVVSLCIIMLMILFVNVLGLDVEPEWHYKITAAESSRECNIVLMNLMNSEASNGYDFAQAIVMAPVATSAEANTYVKEFFSNSTFRYSGCSTAEEIGSEFVCCSQHISGFNGKTEDVSLLFEISPNAAGSEEELDE
jgi:hypothetical protein